VRKQPENIQTQTAFYPGLSWATSLLSELAIREHQTKMDLRAV
jgi:hypothetical protein